MLNPMMFEMDVEVRQRALNAELEYRRLLVAARSAKESGKPKGRNLLQRLSQIRLMPRLGYAAGAGPFPLASQARES